MRLIHRKIELRLLIITALLVMYIQTYSQETLLPDYSVNQKNSAAISSKSPFNYIKVKRYSRRHKAPDPLLNTLYNYSQANIKPNHKASGMSVGLQLPLQ